MPHLALELAVVLAMAAVTVVMHMLGLAGLTQATRYHINHLRTPWLSVDRFLAPLSMVMGLFLLHGAEVAVYAAVLKHVLDAPSWDMALYVSAAAYSTAGWTGVTVHQGWRLLAAFESLNGMLLLGWSTAFLFQSLHRILQTEETHPLPEGALAEEVEEAVEEAVERVSPPRPAPPRPRRDAAGPAAAPRRARTPAKSS